jgi:predicted DCC family thiol-disulfide oxidoreductase YuxK
MKAKHIILFDDRCSLCWRSVNKVLAWDKKKKFRFTPLRDEISKAVLKNRWKELKNANTLILIENYLSKEPRIWIRGRAVMRIFWLLGGAWKLLGWIAFIPYGVDPLYTLIANRRHRL